MRSLPGLVLALLVVLSVAVIAAFYLSQRSSQRDRTELEWLAVRFMDCLPKGTTPAKREEIRGILDRFCSTALSGGVHPEDVVQIENELRTYVNAGEIPDSLVFGFVSRVGKATRRLE